MSCVKVSVVMPVYNVESFLNKTLEDVTGQTLREIEIICVDDGSTDHSREIIQQWQKKDARIQLIIQKNQFAGVARNNGLTRANGKYVIFWDSDDMFEAEALEKMYLQAEEEQSDICICAGRRYDTQNDKYISTEAYLDKKKLPEKKTFNKTDMPLHIFDFATNVPWNKLYRREFIEKYGLRYQEIRQANDTFFTMCALFFAERITYVEDVLITYRVNNAESISGKASDAVFCAYESYVHTFNTLIKYKEFEVVKQSFLNRALGGFFHALNIQTSFEAYQKLYDMLVEKGFAAFGLDQYDAQYFFSPWMYEQMQLMHEISAADFLVQKNVSRKLSEDQLKSDKRDLKKRLQKLKTSNEDLKTKIQNLKTEKSEWKATEKSLKRELKRSEKEYQKVVNSREYRLGRVLLAVPRKLKRLFRHK